MVWDRDEFREQMRACRNCGTLCDGDVCDEVCGRELDIREGDEDAEPIPHAFEPDEDDPECCVHCGAYDEDHEV